MRSAPLLFMAMDPAPLTPAQTTAPAPAAALIDLLRQRKFAQVLAAAPAALAAAPGNRDVLLALAVAQRFLGKIPEALQTLASLQRHHPRFSRLYEERGRCFVELRRAPEAIEAFEAALALNHALPGSWSMLQGLYQMGGDPGKVQAAAAQASGLRALPQEVVIASGLFADGDLEAAEAVVRGYLNRHGDHIEAMRLLARIGMVHKVYLDAQILLAAVLERAPDYTAARTEYAFVLLELHRFEEAQAQLERLLRDDPQNVALRSFYAASCAGLGEHQRSIGLYRQLLTGGSGDADIYLSIGHAQKTLGESAAAIDSYHEAARVRADFGDAYWSLANLKTYRFSAEELRHMQQRAADPATALIDRYHLCFALGKALEDGGDFAGAFRSYALGNELKRPECRYRAEVIETNTREQIRVCTPAFFAGRAGFGDPAPDPIFIIGLPRSGSTLIEQILASHSQVEGTQELPDVQQIVTRLRGFDSDTASPRYPQVLESLGAADVQALAAQYLSGTRVYRSGKPYFIDKMPNNFRHLGLIHLMLPNAKIIDARREPMACGFSNFKQLFANGQEFTYSLEDIGRYYRTYLELMAHWQAVLPGRILRVQHEELVADLEASVRRLLDFCGLEFEPQCLSFHETRRSVRTASSEQVRRGLYTDGLEQWRNFEPWLDPLVTALGDARSRYRD
jgi:tetratricopeptide (TPR) repeat protein